MDPKLRHMQQSWAENSARYTDPIGITGRRPDEHEFTAMVNDVSSKLNLREPNVRSILDVGCNNGYLLHRLNPGHLLAIGVDFCFPPLQHAHSRFHTASYCQAEAGQLPFRSDRFDRVLCYSMFHYLPNLDTAFAVCREMLRVLRPGGLMVIGDLLASECIDRIPDEDRKRWTDPNRSFMHCLDNWLFVPVYTIRDQFQSLGGTARIEQQTGLPHVTDYRLDMIVEKR